MNRRTAAVLILTAWAGSLGWLVQRHYVQATPADQVPRWPVPPGSAFHAIRIGDRQYGFSSLAVDTLSEGLRVTELVTIDLPPLRPNTPRRTSTRVEALYTRGLQLKTWQADFLGEHGRLSSTGSVSGDTLLTIVNTPRGEPAETLSVELRRPIVLANAVPLVAASRGLPRPGSKLNIEVYDPFDHELRTERLAVTAESVFTVTDSAEYSETLRRWRSAHTDTVRAWRIDGVDQGLPRSRWVDAAGMTVLEDFPLGARLERTAFEIGNTNFRALPIPRWDTSASAPQFVPIEGKGPPPPLDALTVVAHLPPDRHLPPTVAALVGGWQRREGDTIRVEPGALEDSATEAPPGAVEALIEQDSLIARTAANIAARERAPEAQARALSAWVRRSITLRDGSGGRSASGTLSQRSGTAEERVALLVALARAAGFAARPVWGLALADGRWQMRPWAEYRNEGWTPLDPDAPGPKAMVGRVRLATGGRPRLLDLALRAGRLRLDLLETTP
jgi:hypothetical protein